MPHAKGSRISPGPGKRYGYIVRDWNSGAKGAQVTGQSNARKLDGPAGGGGMDLQVQLNVLQINAGGCLNNFIDIKHRCHLKSSGFCCFNHVGNQH